MGRRSNLGGGGGGGGPRRGGGGGGGGGGGILHALVEVTNKGLSRVMYRSLVSAGSRACSMTEPSK